MVTTTPPGVGAGMVNWALFSGSPGTEPFSRTPPEPFRGRLIAAMARRTPDFIVGFNLWHV